jgi:hypothetical protein
MFEHLLYTNIIVPKGGVDCGELMESFPPESTEHAEKKHREEYSHKKAPVMDDTVDDKKRQAAEIIYLERYE